MQIINFIRWLKDVVEGLGGTTPVLRLELIREPDFKRVHISFHIPIRHMDFVSMELEEVTPMVSVLVMGGVALIWVTYERLAVEA